MNYLKNYNVNLVQKAIIKWRGYDERSQLVGRDMYEFANFIGHPTRPNSDLIVDTTNPDITRLIDLINGPNGNTILKMLQVKFEDKPK